VLAPEIFTRARHWRRLASAHHKLNRESPENVKGEYSKSGLKFHIFHYNFGDSGRNLTKFYQVMWHTTVVMTCTLILQGVPPTKFGRVKNVQNSAQFLTTFNFDRKYLRNGSTYQKLEKYLINYISSPIGRKNLVNFGPQTKKL